MYRQEPQLNAWPEILPNKGKATWKDKMGEEWGYLNSQFQRGMFKGSPYALKHGHWPRRVGKLEGYSPVKTMVVYGAKKDTHYHLLGVIQKMGTNLTRNHQCLLVFLEGAHWNHHVTRSGLWAINPTVQLREELNLIKSEDICLFLFLLQLSSFLAPPKPIMDSGTEDILSR